MNNQIISKLTLYDFFAMLVPGSLIEVELDSIIANQQLSDVLSLLNLGIIQIAVATIIAYLLGLLAAKLTDFFHYIVKRHSNCVLKRSIKYFKKQNPNNETTIRPDKEFYNMAYYKIMEKDKDHATSLVTINAQERQFAMLRTMLIPLFLFFFIQICSVCISVWLKLGLIAVDILAMLYTQFRIYMCVWEDYAYLPK